MLFIDTKGLPKKKLTNLKNKTVLQFAIGTTVSTPNLQPQSIGKGFVYENTYIYSNVLRQA